VNRLFFEQSQRGLAAVGFEADKAQRLADSNAELADALFIVNDQEADAEVFPVESGLA
jgi:hypothetical protein